MIRDNMIMDVMLNSVSIAATPFSNLVVFSYAYKSLLSYYPLPLP